MAVVSEQLLLLAVMREGVGDDRKSVVQADCSEMIVRQVEVWGT